MLLDEVRELRGGRLELRGVVAVADRRGLAVGAPRPVVVDVEGQEVLAREHADGAVVDVDDDDRAEPERPVEDEGPREGEVGLDLDGRGVDVAAELDGRRVALDAREEPRLLVAVAGASVKTGRRASTIDVYGILGIDKDADDAAIRRAYKKTSLKAHPDRGGRTSIFQKVKKAHDVLSDEQARRDYDAQADSVDFEKALHLLKNAARPLAISLIRPVGL